MCFSTIRKREDATIIITYVADILMALQNPIKIGRIGEELAKHFKLRNLEDVKYCLEVEFKQTNSCVTLNQRGYTNNILERYSMSECNPSKARRRLTKHPYREATIRPNISLAVRELRQFDNCYGEKH